MILRSTSVRLNSICLLALGASLAVAADGPLVKQAGLEVTAIGKSYRPDAARVVVQQSQSNTGGNTSARNVGEDDLDWKESGYFQRNRDLGQVFTAERDFRLAAIVLRTGPAEAAVLAGAPGAAVFVQFFEVRGEPRIHDNGTPPGTAATHGFSTNHRCDDYLTGVEYLPWRLVTGGTFPDLPPTRDAQGQATGNKDGCLAYMRWRFICEAQPEFVKGQRYAFMVGFQSPGPGRGFTLGNANAAGVDAPPSLNDAHDRYHGGWGLRREGDGTVPPSMIPGPQPPGDAAKMLQLRGESLFADGDDRFRLSPTTVGFPDVDTYRDLEFYLETE